MGACDIGLVPLLVDLKDKIGYLTDQMGWTLSVGVGLLGILGGPSAFSGEDADSVCGKVRTHCGKGAVRLIRP